MVGSEVKRTTRPSYTEIFEQNCPYYMAMGMSYNDFWNGAPEMVISYRKADEIARQRQNQMLWLQGMYFYEALCDVSPLLRTQFKKGKVKPHEYTREPYPITEMEIEARKRKEQQLKEEKMKAEFARFALNMQRRIGNNGNNY